MKLKSFPIALENVLCDPTGNGDESEAIPVFDLSALKFAELVKSVESLQCKGVFKLTVTLKPSSGAIAVTAQVQITKPKGPALETIYYATKDGTLEKDDPQQTPLPFEETEETPPQRRRGRKPKNVE